MAPGEINRELDRLARKRSKLTDRFIAAGRGYERWSEISTQSDPLSLEAIAIDDRRTLLETEIRLQCGPDCYRFPTGWQRSHR